MKKIIFIAVLLLLMPYAKAAANLEVTAFSCNPNEVVINNQFSCTATIQNTGDAGGTPTGRHRVGLSGFCAAALRAQVDRIPGARAESFWRPLFGR